MNADEGDQPKLTYHEGLTELQELKRTMLLTVCRYCVVALIIAVGAALIVALVHSRFWSLFQEQAKHL